MLKRVSMSALALFFVAGATGVRAQQQQAVKQPKSAAKKAARSESDPLAEVRRITAVLARQHARGRRAHVPRPAAARARAGPRRRRPVGDERERAVLLFRRAWDEAEAADAESDRKLEEEKRRQVREQGFSSIQLPPSIRTEVLRLAAKRDRALGEEFLSKMEEARKREAENAVTSNEKPTEPRAEQQPARPDRSAARRRQAAAPRRAASRRRRR